MVGVTREAARFVFSGVPLAGDGRIRDSLRTDLPSRGIDVITPKRVWVLCPEGGDDGYQQWFAALSTSVSSRLAQLRQLTGDPALDGSCVDGRFSGTTEGVAYGKKEKAEWIVANAVNTGDSDLDDVLLSVHYEHSGAAVPRIHDSHSSSNPTAVQ